MHPSCERFLLALSLFLLFPRVPPPRASLRASLRCPPLGEQIGGTSGGAGLAPPLSSLWSLHRSHSASPSPTSGSSWDFSLHPPLSSPLSPAFMPRTQLLLLRTGNGGQPSNSPGDVAPKGVWGQGVFWRGCLGVWGGSPVVESGGLGGSCGVSPYIA